MAVMKQVVLNLGQPQYTMPASSRAGASKASAVKSQSAKPSVTFEQAERDQNIYTPQPTEFVSLHITSTFRIQMFAV